MGKSLLRTGRKTEHSTFLSLCYWWGVALALVLFLEVLGKLLNPSWAYVANVAAGGATLLIILVSFWLMLRGEGKGGKAKVNWFNFLLWGALFGWWLWQHAPLWQGEFARENGAFFFNFALAAVIASVSLRWRQAQKQFWRVAEPLRDWQRKAAQVVTVRSERRYLTFPLHEVEKGWVLRIKKGEMIPVRGQLVSRQAELSCAEGKRKYFARAGAFIPAGDFNVGRALLLRVGEDWKESTNGILACLTHPRRASTYVRTRTAKRWHLLAWMGGLGVVLAGVWLAGGGNLILLTSATLLWAAASRPELALQANEFFVLALLAASARKRVFWRRLRVLRPLARLQLLFLDKTGILTTGTMQLVEVEPTTVQRWKEEDVLYLAASVEERIKHPIARAIVTAARERGIKTERAQRIQHVVGEGVVGFVNRSRVLVGTKRLLQRYHLDLPAGLRLRAEQLEDQGYSVVFVGAAGRVAGLLAFRDTLRPEAKALMEELKRMGVSVALVTGDNPRTAQALARRVGIKEVHWRVSARGKARLLRLAQEQGKTTAFVGDAVEDVYPLSVADVGIVLHEEKQPVRRIGDLLLLHKRLGEIAFILSWARRGQREQQDWIGGAVFYHIVVVFGVIVCAAWTPLAGWLSIILLLAELVAWLPLWYAFRLRRAFL
jgi:Cu+-exporting ATPase